MIETEKSVFFLFFVSSFLGLFFMGRTCRGVIFSKRIFLHERFKYQLLTQYNTIININIKGGGEKIWK
ncbi:MAG: hypothetical protein DRN24_00850 [Thermoplasmata archaeon]|nr:MAG: hypothetical protein DRN24_00850 [Thermoplasmata archaeon]